ncbi:hypothetical protein BaRGS_00022392 [Batillaria attramentaria]|uniref:C-type lectin domain-containing protein n=1 Tax=Batillaria attramentaria TaxID=370345 RepID=A0ABD0KGX3_9CAEN
MSRVPMGYFFWSLVIAGAVLHAAVSLTTDDVVFNWVFADGLYYWIATNRTDFTTAVCACHLQQENARLAVFDFATPVSDLEKFLLMNYRQRRFWVDATRSTSITPPSIFDPAPNMTWVTIGTSGEAFAFSREELPLEEAREACEQLGGGSHLAVLDTTLEEVGNYTLEKYPFRQFWVNASRRDIGSVLTMEWTRLRSSGLVLSFVNIPTDFQTARQHCANQPGDVRLAYFSTTTLPEVKEHVALLSSGLTYWVDATADQDSGYYWVDGGKIGVEDWVEGTIQETPGVAYLTSSGLMTVSITSDEKRPFIFASSQGMSEFPHSCPYAAPEPPSCSDLTTTSVPSTEPTTPSTEALTTATLTTEQSTKNAVSTTFTTEPNELHTTSAATLSTDFAETTAGTEGRKETTETITTESSFTTESTDVTTMSSDGTTTSSDATTTGSDVTSTSSVASTTSGDATTTSSGVSTEPIAETTQTLPTSTTVSPNTPTPTAPPQTPVMCQACCRAVNVTARNLSAIEVQQQIEEIRVHLRVDKRNLSATVRRKMSAPDNRPSARATGISGVVVMMVVFGAIVVPDLYQLFSDRSSLVPGKSAPSAVHPRKASASYVT